MSRHFIRLSEAKFQVANAWFGFQLFPICKERRRIFCLVKDIGYLFSEVYYLVVCTNRYGYCLESVLFEYDPNIKRHFVCPHKSEVELVKLHHFILSIYCETEYIFIYLVIHESIGLALQKKHERACAYLHLAALYLIDFFFTLSIFIMYVLILVSFFDFFII